MTDPDAQAAAALAAAAAAAADPVLPPFDPGEVRAVAFDAFGTLFSWDFHREVGEVLHRQRLEAPYHDVAETFEQAWATVSPWAEVTDADGRPDRTHMLRGPAPAFITTHEMWRRQFELTFGEHGLTGDALAGAGHLRDVLRRAPAYPDAYDTLEALAAHGLRLGLLSNADEDFLQGAISHNRLRFSVIQSSESLRIYKPNVAAFRALCERLECSPGEVLYVGDSVPTDVGGARHAGLRTAWVERPGARPYPEDEPPPDLHITQLAELVSALGVAAGG